MHLPLLKLNYSTLVFTLPSNLLIIIQHKLLTVQDTVTPGNNVGADSVCTEDGLCVLRKYSRSALVCCIKYRNIGYYFVGKFNGTSPTYQYSKFYLNRSSKKNYFRYHRVYGPIVELSKSKRDKKNTVEKWNR